MNKPPRLPRALARLFLSTLDAERLFRALDEEYSEAQVRDRGRFWASVWYWRQALLSVLPLRRAARVGGVRNVAEAKQKKGVGGVDSIFRDVRYGFRKLGRSPSYTFVAVVTLALGIGANSAIFSVVRTVLLEALPYDGAEQIHRAWAHADDGSIEDFSFRVAEYKELNGRTGVFEAVGAEFPIDMTVLIPDQDPRQVSGRRITRDFFKVFGTTPAVGRTFSAEEVESGEALVALVSHAFWMQSLGGSQDVLGRTVNLAGADFTVIGVLPEGYSHISGDDVGVFIPYSLGTARWIAHWLDLYVRLSPGMTATRATEEIDAVIRAVGETEERSRGWHATLEPLHEMVVGDVRMAVWAVFGTATLVLLIACVNVANLTLARATVRRGEMSLRRSLGAGRGRLAVQLLIENVLLTTLGGVAGVALAYGGLEVLLSLAPAAVPRLDTVGVDPSVIGFALVITLATGIAFGLLPLLGMKGGTTPQRGATRNATPGGGTNRVLNGLVTAQVAVAITLLVGAGLMIKAFQTLQREDLGFDRGGTLVFRIVVPASRYPTAVDTESFYTRLRGELGALPGVTAVGAGANLPVAGDGGAVSSVTTLERVQAGIDEPITVLQRRATEGYFAAMSTPVLEGRGFDSRDGREAPRVTVISAGLADQLFPGTSAVGKQIGWGGSPDEDDWLTVVGVVADVRYRQADFLRDPQVYQAHPQSAVRDMAMMVRTEGDPRALIAGAREAVRRLDPQVPMYSLTTLADLVDRSVAGRRFTMTMFTLFAVIALTVTAAGLYGVLTFAVQQRRREIGVRMALGADISTVTHLVVGRGLRMTVIGLALGVAGALLIYRLLESLLYQVSPGDVGVYLIGITILAGVAWLASYIPARRACRVDPVTVLRED